MYKNRLNHCKLMAIHDKPEFRQYWRDAVEIYIHLINCKDAHSIKKLKTGTKMCKEFSI